MRSIWLLTLAVLLGQTATRTATSDRFLAAYTQLLRKHAEARQALQEKYRKEYEEIAQDWARKEVQINQATSPEERTRLDADRRLLSKLMRAATEVNRANELRDLLRRQGKELEPYGTQAVKGKPFSAYSK